MPQRGHYQGARNDIYQTPGNAYLRDSVTVRSSLTYRYSDQISFGIAYAGQFNNQTHNNQLNLMLRWQF